MFASTFVHWFNSQKDHGKSCVWSRMKQLVAKHSHIKPYVRYSESQHLANNTMGETVQLKANATEVSVVSTQHLALKAGLITSLCLVAYFMLMIYLNLIQILELRALNFLILGTSLFLSFRYYQAKTKKKMAYLQGLLFGLSVTAFSVTPFAVFTGVYFGWIDPLLLIKLKDNAPVLGAYISPVKIACATAFEGMASGMVISFGLMQYFKNDSPHEEKSDEPKA